MTRVRASVLLGAVGLALGLYFGHSTPAQGFCGFYVAGADAALYNDATIVVLMRDGQRTVLSMQNNYQGPPEDFALVIPVPVVLREGDVKTLPNALFDHVDKLAAPRLVEYWEQDPCAPRKGVEERKDREAGPQNVAFGPPGGHGVTIEAQFVVGEYEVVILSAEDSTGLDTWLRQEQYNIPAGTETVLRPYVQSGMKFFVAKVDVEKVKFEVGADGVERAMLSPLRFHYDSDEFSLPVRLGLLNAKGAQDLLIHILAPQQRYEAANYPNVTIPTNLVVKDAVRERFGQFYVSLFDHTLAKNPKAIVTEYAWPVVSCDPCPTPTLDRYELIVLGADVLPRYAAGFDPQGALIEDSDVGTHIRNEFVLTRLHARYDASSLGEDLVFAQANGIVGGQGMPSNGKLSPDVSDAGEWNGFQARYAILNHWDGPVGCMRPLWDQWGGPPSGGSQQPAVAQQLAFEPRDAKLESFVSRSAHAQLALAGEPPPDERPNRVRKAEQKAEAAAAGEKGCACTTTSNGSTNNQTQGTLACVLGLGLLGWARRRSTHHQSARGTRSEPARRPQAEYGRFPRA